MANDRTLSTTDDMSFAALACYAFGFESLQLIDTTHGRAIFSFCVPSCDFDLLLSEFKSKEDVPVQCFQYCKTFDKINRLVREARKGYGQWTSESWRTGAR